MPICHKCKQEFGNNTKVCPRCGAQPETAPINGGARQASDGTEKAVSRQGSGAAGRFPGKLTALFGKIAAASSGVKACAVLAAIALIGGAILLIRTPQGNRAGRDAAPAYVSESPSGSDERGETGTAPVSADENSPSEPAPSLPETPAGDETEYTVIPSIDSGVYPETAELFLTNERGLPIRYTIDGSIPGVGSAVYNAPMILSDIPLNTALTGHADEMFIGDRRMIYPAAGTTKALVIRAAAEMPDGTMGPVMTKTYFLNDDLQERYRCPVISIITDPSNLYDYEIGIMVRGKVFDDNGAVIPEHPLWDRGIANFTQKGKKWEREAWIQLFDGENAVTLEAPCGIRVKGTGSRAYSQRSFNIYFRKDYGQKNIKYSLIPGNTDINGEEITKYKSFTVRNGGNDAQRLKFKDAMTQELLSELDFSTQAYRPVIVYLNGEYYGIFALTEKYSDYYIESHYGVESDNVVIIEDGAVDEGVDEDIKLWEDLMRYASRDSLDLSTEANWEDFLKAVDVQSMADYYAAEIYIANTDWGLYHNYSLWRSRTNDGTPYGDGRWRWLLYDTEYSSGLYQSCPDRDVYYDIRSTAADYDTFSETIKKDNGLFVNALRNPAFRQMFAERMHDLAENTLSPERVNQLLEIRYQEWSRWYPDFRERFGMSPDETPEQVYQNTKTFFENRARYILPVVDEYCGYTPPAAAGDARGD